MLTAYSPSGKNGAIVYALIPPLLIMVVAAAAVYTLLSHWIPLIYASVLLACGFAAMVLFGTKYALTSGKSRNPATGVMLGLLAGIVGVLASHYTAYLWDLRDLPPGMHVPFSKYLEAKVDIGWKIGRSSSGTPINGWAVWIVWAVEAAIIIWAGVKGGLAATRQPFCESCGVWANKLAHSFVIPGLSDQTLQSIGSAPNLDAVLTPPVAEIQPSARTLDYKVQTCPRCDNIGFLDLTLTSRTADKKGNIQTKTKQIGKTAILNAVEVEAVGQLQGDVSAALAARTTRPS